MSSARAQAAASAPPADDDASVLVLGRISDDPKSHYDQLKPLLDSVVPRIAGVGIRSGRILTAKDLQQMASYLRRGPVDWLSETAAAAGLRERRGVATCVQGTARHGAPRHLCAEPARVVADHRGRGTGERRVRPRPAHGGRVQFAGRGVRAPTP